MLDPTGPNLMYVTYVRSSLDPTSLDPASAPLDPTRPVRCRPHWIRQRWIRCRFGPGRDQTRHRQHQISNNARRALERVDGKRPRPALTFHAFDHVEGERASKKRRIAPGVQRTVLALADALAGAPPPLGLLASCRQQDEAHCVPRSRSSRERGGCGRGWAFV